jgi:hypothetical protein
VKLGGVVLTVMGAGVLFPGVWLATNELGSARPSLDVAGRYGVLAVAGGIILVGVTLAIVGATVPVAGAPKEPRPSVRLGIGSASLACSF